MIEDVDNMVITENGNNKVHDEAVIDDVNMMITPNGDDDGIDNIDSNININDEELVEEMNNMLTPKGNAGGKILSEGGGDNNMDNDIIEDIETIIGDDLDIDNNSDDDIGIDDVITPQDDHNDDDNGMM